MPRGVRKQVNFTEELQKIEKQMADLEAKRKELLAQKNEADMKSLSEFIAANNISAAEAIAILSPAVAAAAQTPKVNV